jgi:hypothetical protein
VQQESGQGMWGMREGADGKVEGRHTVHGWLTGWDGNKVQAVSWRMDVRHICFMIRSSAQRNAETCA